MDLHILRLISLIVICHAWPAQATLISSGQTAVYSYDFSGSAVSPPYYSGTWGINFGTDLYNPGESFTMKQFDQSGALVQEGVYNFPSNVAGFSSSFNFSNPLLTPSGTFQVSSLIGTFDITRTWMIMGQDNISIPRTSLNSTPFTNLTFVEVKQTVPAVATPSPATLPLLGLALAALGYSRRRRPQHNYQMLYA